MRKSKKERLERKGWKVGTVEEFLDITPEEAAYIELKLRLSDGLRRLLVKHFDNDRKLYAASLHCEPVGRGP